MTATIAMKTTRGNGVSGAELSRMIELMRNGCSNREIAKIVNQPISTVGDRLAKYSHLRPVRTVAYLPTEAEIETACESIQSEWTDKERRMRQRGRDSRGKEIIPRCGRHGDSKSGPKGGGHA